MNHDQLFTIAILITAQVGLLAILGSKLKFKIKGTQLELSWQR